MSFLQWLGQLDPNVVAPVVISALLFLYHSLFSKSAQAKVASAVNDAIALADRAVRAACSLAPSGTTPEQLEADLLNVASAQLAHAGLDPAKLPAPTLALVKALVNEAIARWKATQPAPLPPPPKPQEVTVLPAPSSEKGFIRFEFLIGIMAIATSVIIAIGMINAGCGSRAGQVTLKTGQCVLDSGCLGELATDLAQSNYVQLVADLGTKFTPALVTCTLEAISSPTTVAVDGGAAPATALAATDVRVARARELLANPALWQSK
jgi:hypothetical protein